MVKVNRLPVYSEISRIFNKAVRRLPNSLRQRFYKYTRNLANCEDFLSLEQLQISLENRVKEQCNPIASKKHNSQ